MMAMGDIRLAQGFDGPVNVKEGIDTIVAAFNSLTTESIKNMSFEGIEKAVTDLAKKHKVDISTMNGESVKQFLVDNGLPDAATLCTTYIKPKVAELKLNGAELLANYAKENGTTSEALIAK